MLDINYIRANQNKVEDAIRNKGYGDEIDLGEILKLDDERKKLAMEADKLRHDRNEISAKMSLLNSILPLARTTNSRRSVVG